MRDSSLESSGPHSPPLLIVAGGGTGGHILAGVAVADEWRKLTGGSVQFIGAEGGLEEKLVPRAGYSLVGLKIGALKGLSIQRKLRTLLQLPRAFYSAFEVLIRLKPQAVLGVGGYSSGPVVLAARLLSVIRKMRIAILEQNAVPGFTNRVLGRFSHHVFTAFPGIEAGFPNKVIGESLTVSGNPVRSGMTSQPHLDQVQGQLNVFVFGGSQGAVGINSIVMAAMTELGEARRRISLLHQTGERDFERVREHYSSLSFPVRVEKFVYEMVHEYHRADLVICRAGSSTLSELACVGRAALLIPFPHASDNHQEKNAMLFVNEGAALMRKQASFTGKELAELLKKWLEDRSELRKMESKLVGLARYDAPRRIVEVLKA